MAIIALEVPRGVCQYLTRFNVPGEKTPIEEMHVTIVQIDEQLTPVQVAIISGIASDVTHTFRQFSATVDHVTCFPPNDHGVPIICPILSDRLHVLHNMIAESLDARGIPFSKKFPVYQPHTTLSWGSEVFEPMSLVQPLTWTVSHVAMWPTRDGARQAVRFGLRSSSTALKQQTRQQ